jgi:hypothetical protein
VFLGTCAMRIEFRPAPPAPNSTAFSSNMANISENSDACSLPPNIMSLSFSPCLPRDKGYGRMRIGMPGVPGKKTSLILRLQMHGNVQKRTAKCNNCHWPRKHAEPATAWLCPGLFTPPRLLRHSITLPQGWLLLIPARAQVRPFPRLRVSKSVSQIPRGEWWRALCFRERQRWPN